MTPEQRELKPCPFCGDKMDLPIHDQVERGAGLIYVSCDCGASSPGCKTRDDSIAAWNRRVQVEALTVPQWIRVDDRLPHAFIPVLAHGAKRLEFAVMTYTEKDGWEVETTGDRWASYAPKFWMPLPTAPTIPAIPGTKEDA